eukprot:1184090-Prorocentrum_minimum.AAC.1
MANKYGLFSETAYLAIGDPYIDKDPLNHRTQGLNFKVREFARLSQPCAMGCSLGHRFRATKCKSGITNDAMFDRTKPLYEGEKYTKSNGSLSIASCSVFDGVGVYPRGFVFQEKAQAREAKAKSMASDHPFRPSGKFKNKNSEFGHLPEQDLNKMIKQKGDFESEPRNIVTNPAKKGTFGFNKTTLGERIGFGGAVGEYSYAPSPYDSVRA